MSKAWQKIIHANVDIASYKLVLISLLATPTLLWMLKSIYLTAPNTTITFPLLWMFSLLVIGRYIPELDPLRISARLIFPPRNNENRLDILDIFRTFAIVWVMANHLGSEGRVDILERRPSGAVFKDSVHTNLVFGPFFGNSSLGVEIFLVLSGLLAAKSWNKRADTPFTTHYMAFITRRFLRIFPALAVFILLAFTTVSHFLPRFGTTMLGACNAPSVASILTFTNNFAATPTCLGYLWYLGLDMQLYLSAPIILHLLRRRPRLGIVACIFIISVSSLLRAIHCYVYGVCNQSDVDIPFISRPDDDAATLSKMYLGLWDMYARPHTKCGPFVIGLLVGQFIDAVKSRLEAWRARRPSIVALWHRRVFFGAFLISIVAIYGILPQYRHPEMGSSHVYNIAYTALFRNIFALAIAVMIIALYYDKFELKVRPIWTTLARLSFNAYLVHMPVMYFFNYYAPYQQSSGVAGLLGTMPLAIPLSFVLAAIFHCFVEVPLSKLLERAIARL